MTSEANPQSVLNILRAILTELLCMSTVGVQPNDGTTPVRIALEIGKSLAEMSIAEDITPTCE
jgi:hypothetical protein